MPCSQCFEHGLNDKNHIKYKNSGIRQYIQ